MTLFKSVQKYIPRHIVPAGWIPMKLWRLNEAVKCGVSESCISHWLYQDKRYPHLKIRRRNKRVVWVKE